MRKIQILALIALLSLLPLMGVGGNQSGMVGSVKAKEDQCDLESAVLAGSSYGVACIDDSGWNFYKTNGILKSAGTAAFSVCPDGVLAFSNFNGVSLFDGKKTTTLAKPPASSVGSKTACGGADNIWVTGLTENLFHFDGKAWETFKTKDVFGGTTAFINGLELTPDGKGLWVITGLKIGFYDGKDWAVYDKDNGLKQTYSFTGSLVFDSKGTTYIGLSNGLLKYDGKAFTAVTQTKAYAKSLAIDSKDVIWLGTLTDGVYSFDGKKWTPFGRKEKALSSNRVNDIDVDEQDRVWVATGWGVNVFDGKKWTVFQAANSDLVENSATSIIALGKGPKLPELVEKKPGKVIGKIIQGRDPLAKTTIELCSEGAPVALFTGKTPCGDYPDARSAKTDDNGEFEIDDVPIGRYGFVVQGADKKWFTFFGSGASIVIKEGETFDLETITLKSQ